MRHIDYCPKCIKVTLLLTVRVSGCKYFVHGMVQSLNCTTFVCLLQEADEQCVHVLYTWQSLAVFDHPVWGDSQGT